MVQVGDSYITRQLADYDLHMLHDGGVKSAIVHFVDYREFVIWVDENEADEANRRLG
jgi:hypothetical protein